MSGSVKSFRIKIGWLSGAALLLLLQATSLGAGSEPAEIYSTQSAAGVVAAERPRLFFGREGLARLRIVIQTSHREKWLKLKAAVDSSLGEEPPAYKPPEIGGDSTRPGTMNDEMLWQRTYGYKLPGMALVALLS